MAEDRIQMFLIDPTVSERPRAECVTDACERLIELIDGANSSVDFALYGMRTQNNLLRALLRAQDRGIQIRGVIDREVDGINIYSSTEEWITSLGSVRDDLASERKLLTTDSFDGTEPSCTRPKDTKGPLQCVAYDLGDRWLAASFAAPGSFSTNRIMHNKFVIIDQHHVWTGSANISDTGTGGYNANAVIVLTNPAAAEIYTNEFEQMWRGLYHEDKLGSRNSPDRIAIADNPVQIWFSPQDQAMRYAVRPFIANATQSLNISTFFLTDKWVVADLIAAHRRGVDIRVIVDATSARNSYSKHQLLREAGISVKVENWGGKMHMKAASSDGSHLIAGSMNWTSAGNYSNDENTVLIESADLAKQYDAFFERLWQSIPEKWLITDPAPESEDSVMSCDDEIDNDFDNLIDVDPECDDDGIGGGSEFLITVWDKSNGTLPSSRGYRLIDPHPTQ